MKELFTTDTKNIYSTLHSMVEDKKEDSIEYLYEVYNFYNSLKLYKRLYPKFDEFILYFVSLIINKPYIFGIEHTLVIKKLSILIQTNKLSFRRFFAFNASITLLFLVVKFFFELFIIFLSEFYF